MNGKFDHWYNHFESNKGHFDHILFDSSSWISPKEKSIIGKSIAIFQRGENSEGRNLIHAAKEWGDASYLKTIQSFIREEQNHAKILAVFMKENGIPPNRKNFSDSVFRKIRSWGTIEHSVYILVTAEMVAAVYYDALRNCTKSETLNDICIQILSDEEFHLEFQAYTLSHFYEKRNSFRRAWILFHHWVLTQGAILMVWKDHRKIFKTAGISFFLFVKSVNAVRNRTFRKMKNYSNKQALFLLNPNS